MVKTQSSILNNDFYIFILILLLIIMLFMLSPKNKERFNINISKIKLNNKESFEDVNSKFKFDVSNKVILRKDIVKAPYLLKYDIIKLYNSTIPEEDLEYGKTLYYFNIIDKVSFNENNDYVIDTKIIDDLDTFNDNENSLDSVKVVGSQKDNAVLSTDIKFEKIVPRNDNEWSNYRIKLDFKKKDTQDPDNDKIKDISNLFEIDDVIEIHHPEIDRDNNLFLIKKIDTNNEIYIYNKSIVEETVINTVANIKETNTNLKIKYAFDDNTNQFKIFNEDNSIYTDSDNNEITFKKYYEIVNTNSIPLLIKKFDLNEIGKEYYESIQEYNKNYLLKKNEIEKIGMVVDHINEQINNN